jgi:hypothetical protein
LIREEYNLVLALELDGRYRTGSLEAGTGIAFSVGCVLRHAEAGFDLIRRELAAAGARAAKGKSGRKHKCEQVSTQSESPCR